LTTTKFWSMRTTSAVMTSPARISWRARLSSKRAAKLSSKEGVALDIGIRIRHRRGTANMVGSRKNAPKPTLLRDGFRPDA